MNREKDEEMNGVTNEEMDREIVKYMKNAEELIAYQQTNRWKELTYKHIKS
jgi:hypothetical protein